MQKIINFKGKTDTKVKIYVETAMEIFQRCLDKATPDKNGSIYYGLARGIMEEFSESHIFEVDIDGKYLINTKSRIETYRKQNKLYIGFSHTFILRLALFAGIRDYLAFDESNGPRAGIPVLFVLQPFKFFDLIRVPRSGLLFGIDNGWELADSDPIKISGNVNDAKLFLMPGDRSALWIEVKYNDQDTENTVYFADYNSIIQPVSTSGRLFSFFTKKINR